MHSRIMHVDMDAFFASVEQARNPALLGKALIIGGDKTDSRGVVSTASYEARKYGVHSAMSLAEAKRLCPNGIFMRGNYQHYAEVSREVRSVLDTVSPLVEMASIDEAYVDVTGSQRIFGGDDGIARYVKSEIRKRTGVPCTVAITPNKLVSKIASSEGKPDGYVCVKAGGEATYLRPLVIGKLPGIGPKTQQSLEAKGFKTLGQLAALPTQRAVALLGPGGYALQRRARGESSAQVVTEWIPKSIGRETTFGTDLLDWPRIEGILAYLTERTMHALRAKRMEARCVTLKVRYKDFSTYTFAKTLPGSTCVDRDVTEALEKLLPNAKERRAPVRLIGVSLSELNYNQHQLLLFDPSSADKWERLLHSMDEVRDRYGFQFLRFGKSTTLGRDIRLATPALSQ